METEKKGRAKGGLARKEALTHEERIRIAKKGAAARWGEKPVTASHKGNFKDEFGIDVECYVLNDEQKTAVISKRGMATALGLGNQAGNLFGRFIKGAKIASVVGAEILAKIEKPLVFEHITAEQNPHLRNTIHGYDVTILIDICKAVLTAHAEGVLLKQQHKVVEQARIIINASAKAGIKNLVYALAGYDATRAEIIAAFKFYVREEAREYEREFPEQLYGEWYRLYKLPKPERNKPWKFKDLTLDHVYVPLARSNGKILALTRAQKASSEDRHAKLHQFLSEIGVKALRTHLGTLLGIAILSPDAEQYERNVFKVFGGQSFLDFNMSSTPMEH